MFLSARLKNTVYPRVCGGTYLAAPVPLPRTGLSPRVRGNLFSFILAIRIVRSIPACAGEPLSSAAASALIEVYPRVCGGTE